MTPPRHTALPCGNDPDKDLPNDLIEDLHRAIGLVEDWLLHASDETLNELAEFVYGPAHPGHDQLQWIIELLGIATTRLRPAPQPAAQPAAIDAATPKRWPR
jgi:hypothetical protein